MVILRPTVHLCYGLTLTQITKIRRPPRMYHSANPSHFQFLQARQRVICEGQTFTSSYLRLYYYDVAPTRRTSSAVVVY